MGCASFDNSIAGSKGDADFPYGTCINFGCTQLCLNSVSQAEHINYFWCKVQVDPLSEIILSLEVVVLVVIQAVSVLITLVLFILVHFYFYFLDVNVHGVKIARSVCKKNRYSTVLIEA